MVPLPCQLHPLVRNVGAGRGSKGHTPSPPHPPLTRLMWLAYDAGRRTRCSMRDTNGAKGVI